MNFDNRLSVFFVSISMVIMIIGMIIIGKEDKIPPKITFRSSKIVYSDGMDKSKLLENVSANDDKDGNVTDSIVIEKITMTSDEKAVIVTYAARDHSNNFVKASRIFEKAVVEKTEVQKEERNDGEVGKPSGIKGESEEKEGNNPEADSDTQSIEPDKEKAQRMKEEKQEKDDVMQDAKVSEESPVLVLNTAETTLHKGDSFNINDYVEQLSDDVDTLEILQHKIQTNGAFDNNVVGDYQVTVLVSDSEGNQSETQQLVIHVVE